MAAQLHSDNHRASNACRGTRISQGHKKLVSGPVVLARILIWRSGMANLSVNICGLEFANPILPAAGPPSKDGAMLQAAAKGGAGGLVTKTISVNPAEVPRPCMAEIKGGF